MSNLERALTLLLLENDTNNLIEEYDQFLSNDEIATLYKILDERGRVALARLEQRRLNGNFYSTPFS